MRPDVVEHSCLCCLVRVNPIRLKVLEGFREAVEQERRKRGARSSRATSEKPAKNFSE